MGDTLVVPEARVRVFLSLLCYVRPGLKTRVADLRVLTADVTQRLFDSGYSTDIVSSELVTTADGSEAIPSHSVVLEGYVETVLLFSQNLLLIK